VKDLDFVSGVIKLIFMEFGIGYLVEDVDILNDEAWFILGQRPLISKRSSF